MRDFKAETVDASGKPIFSSADAKIIYKVGKLTGFNIYWNCSNNTDALITPTLETDKNENWAVNRNNSPN